MSVATPRTQELADDLVAKIEVETEQDVSLLDKAFTRVLSKVYAGAHVLIYKVAGFLQAQMFIRYATMNETVVNGRKIRPLLELGRELGEPDPSQAEPAQLTVRVTVTTQVGELPARSQLLYAPLGVLYITTQAKSLNAATIDVPVLAAADPQGGGGAGAIGNRTAGDELEFANPLPNVARKVTVVSVDVVGIDGESVEQYRARVLRRSQRKPQGGAYADYDQWGRTVPGILNIYPYAGAPGEVDVYAEATPESSGSADGIPTLAQRDAVKAAIERDESGLASNRPVGALANVFPIVRLAFDVQVNGLAADDISAAQTAISAAISEFMLSREPFIDGLSVLPRVDRITSAAVAGVVHEAVSAVGGTVTTVSLTLGGIPITGYTLGKGQKAKPGTISF